ncbi:IS110 family RNA-guided transposase [Luteipulveratus halotolerans]|uniref:Transposase n=1 Tax=Luteipulveratus halotolerans TaxID=1631356 RepID=A0A0L6CLC2_9MICO|nr:IS110 family transposase [Luteipulveratus halotolerans]KNX38596.1 transposase [Luteipulveratus halotolerans]
MTSSSSNEVSGHPGAVQFVAVDEVGKQIGQLTVAATSAGHAKALRWARTQLGEELTWAVEDCRHLSARLERDLLSAGQQVVRVPPKMMAEQRRIARTRGKSDPIDALAVARAYLREPDLPVASHDEVSREVKLLVDRRDALVATRTRTINSLLWRVHELDPRRAPKPRSLDLAKHQQLLRAWLGTLSGVVAEMALDELDDAISLTARIKTFERRIRQLARQHAPSLVAMPGCGELSAAKLLGESAGISRFHSEAAFARHGGLAPIPVWSGSTAGRVRMTRSGNRQINCAIHRIAITQQRMPGSLGRAYYDKKIAEGKTKTEALGCLKRRLVRVIFNHLTTDQTNRQTATLPTAA